MAARTLGERKPGRDFGILYEEKGDFSAWRVGERG